MPQLRSTLIVALYDLLESLRSRKAVVILVLYVTTAVSGSLIFLATLRRLASAVAEQLGRPERPPAELLADLMERPEYLDLIAMFARDAETAYALATVHPLALFYGWLAMSAVPLLLLFTSSSAITEDVAAGTSRFVLTRTDRTSWVLGKLIGQTGLLLVGLIAGALAALLVGTLGLPGFERSGTVVALLRMSLRAGALGFAFLGLYLGVSQLTRSVPWARALAVLAWLGTSLSGALLGSLWFRELVPAAEWVRQFTPKAHADNLWHPDPAVTVPAVLALVAFGLVTFAMGHAVFQRSDA